jgi:hypothetical protein
MASVRSSISAMSASARSEDPGARLGGYDDGPLRLPDRSEPVGRREEGHGAHRGPLGGLDPDCGRNYKTPARKLASDLGVWVEPPVGIEPTTFSLRGRPTASHSLSTGVFANTGVRIEREIPHQYPQFRATDDATRSTATLTAWPPGVSPMRWPCATPKRRAAEPITVLLSPQVTPMPQMPSPALHALAL